MLDRIVLLHSANPQAFSELDRSASPGQWLAWNTCLRSIRIGTNENLFTAPDCDAYEGADAYRFCLEVVTGLHSPLVGETEVMGQFRAIAKSLESSSGPEIDPAVKRFFRSILSDAKAVRQSHLVNLGSQSYGSLTRKFLKQSRTIHVLGAGQLVEELLPWLKDFASIEIFCRNPAKRQALVRDFSNAHLLPMEGMDHEETDGNALIIAAPLSAHDVLAWIREHGHEFQTLVDLRGEAEADPIHGYAGEIVSLGALFSSIRENQERIQSRVIRAKEEIQKLARAQGQALELHPFGWDDLCG